MRAAAQEIKKLPIGVQSIRKILTGNYLYVDKTDFAEQLIDEGGYYFMSRPRRFGKSLFISTLEEILRGDRELFFDCAIASGEYVWHEYPVIHFDFSQIPNKTPEALEIGLQERSNEIAAAYGVEITGSSLQFRLASLVRQLAEKNPVAILVDEYDKPIIDHLMRPEIASANKEVLKSFFGTLKGLDQYLKIVFVTGISKFSQVSLFSGFNNIQDLTMDAQYSTLMGYTHDEVRHYLQDHVEAVARKQESEFDSVFEEIQAWYNGYCFSEDCRLVFNPFSTLSFLKGGVVRGYWFSSGTPSFLIDQIRKRPLKATRMSAAFAKRSELLDILDITDIDLNALMWQSGYLTIKAYDARTDLYQLDFPNREVRSAFFDSLLREFAKLSLADVAMHAERVRNYLLNYDFDQFFNALNSYYAKIPYHLFNQAKEGFYHAVFLSLMEGIGLKTRAEDATNIGRIDLVIETMTTVFIFELKLDQGADLALKQANERQYFKKYSSQGHNVVIVGANFSSETRNISEWVTSLQG